MRPSYPYNNPNQQANQNPRGPPQIASFGSTDLQA